MGLRVLENRVLSKIFGPKRDKVTGEWTRLHNKELYARYISPNTTGRACSKQETREVYTGFWWENLWKREHLGNLGIDRRILKWIFQTRDVAALTDLVQDRERWRALVNAVMKLQVL